MGTDHPYRSENTKLSRVLKPRQHFSFLTVMAWMCLWIQDSQAMNDENDTNSPDIVPAIELLFSAYAETDIETRNEILGRAVADDVNFWTRTGVLASKQEISDFISEWLETNKGNALHLVTEIQTFRNVARAGWESRLKGRFLFQQGESYFELGDDGRLRQIINFSDQFTCRLFRRIN